MTQKPTYRELESALESACTGVLLVNAKTHRIVDVNNFAAKMIGLSKEQIVGHICHKHICPTEEGQCPITDLGQTVDQSEKILLKANGDSVPIRKTVAVITLNGQDYLLETFTDITKDKEMERALIESEQRLADIINFLPDATFVIDLDGKVIAWNKAIEEMTGVKAEDILGKGNYEYALPFYGTRRPILIDLLFKPDKEIEKEYLRPLNFPASG